MKPADFLRDAINPALRRLPVLMDTDEARAMILAIALQESGLMYRRQINGPARGYTQFERGHLNRVSRSGEATTQQRSISDLLTHSSIGAQVSEFCRGLDLTTDIEEIYTAIAYHDILCAGLSRLLLWTLPDALPTMTQPEEGWAQYLATWRPGKPRHDTWAEHYRIAWQTVLN